MTIGAKLGTTPPPIICGTAVFAGVIVEMIWPLVSLSSNRYIIGGFLIVGSLLAMPGILVKFRREKTPFDVRKDPSALITSGLYKRSRNPTYIALMVLCVGIGVLLSNFWVIVFLVPAGIVIDRYVIPEEERRLEQVFGEEYQTYKSSVRRWV